MGYRPKRLNLREPRSFNEKIIWLKLNYRFPNGHLRVDKVLARDFVSQTIGSEYLIPTLKICSDVYEIDFNALPAAFVAKASHGSAWNIVCSDKSNLNVAEASAKLRRWLNYNYYYVGREWQYYDCPPRIIIEEHLELPGEKPLNDYKIFCFNGVPQLIQVDIDRQSSHTRNFYDTDWQRQTFGLLFPQHNKDVDPPECLGEMLDVAIRLSSDMPFARVDLYCQGGRVYFGEITFHPGGGCEPFSPPSYDDALGEMLQLPKIS